MREGEAFGVQEWPCQPGHGAQRMWHAAVDAAVVGVEPEAYLARARSWALAERDDLARLEGELRVRGRRRPATEREETT